MINPDIINPDESGQNDCVSRCSQARITIKNFHCRQPWYTTFNLVLNSATGKTGEGIKEIQLAENKCQDLGGSLLNDYSPAPTSVWRG